MTIHVVSVLFFSNKKKVMKKWQFSSVLFNLFPRELQFQQKCGLSKSMNSLGGPIESEDPNRNDNDNDKNIPGCSHSESSSYSNVDHLVGVKDIRNCISLLVRYRNGDHYSIVFDLENQILKIKNEPSFLSELKSFSSYRNSSSLNNGSKSEDPFSHPSMDKNKDCSNSINRCIAGYLHFKTGIDTSNGSGNENYCGASFVDCFIKRDYLEHLRWLRGIRRGNFSHLWVQCDNEECSGLNYKKYFKQKMYICEHCSSHLKMTSSDRIELLLDLGTWDPMDEDIVCVDPIQWDFVEDDDEEEKEEEGNSNIKCASEIECALESEEPLDSEEESKPSEEPLDLDSEEKPSEEPLSSEEIKKNILEQIHDVDEKLSKMLLDLDSEEESKPSEEPLSSEEEEKPSEDKNLSSEEEEKPSEDKSLSSEEEEEEEETYKERLDSYQRETQLKEAIQTGTGQINGIPVAIGVMDFRFMAGSMGFVVGEKITRLIEYATQKFLPLIIVCASGGARMQEGSLSLMQMAKISSALLDYQVNKKLFYISILTSPTTGGVTASFGMLGDIVIAEPNAYIAFAGKRVIEETLKIIVPEGVQETEYLFDKGAFDLIVPRTLLKSVLTELFQFHAFFPLNQNSIK